MRKFLGKPSIDHTTDSGLPTTSSPSVSTRAVYRPSAAQNAIFQAGAPISCLDRSADGRSAVLAGRHVLKIVSFDHLTIEERVDLRAAINAAKPSASAPISDQLSIKDVKWAPPTSGGPAIFTACANGKIFHSDISRLAAGALDIITMREDSRQVNTLDVNPHRGTFLLSGSQDGFVRGFDIREPATNRAGFVSFPTLKPPFKCNDGVRRVQWSPKEAFFFACGTDSGAVLKWDLRKATSPLLRINAHDANSACTSLAWHPDGEHIVSAGTDARLHVWDISGRADKRQKPKMTISAPSPVASVAWRPGQWSATAQGRRAAQLAVSYGDTGGRRLANSVVHLWDFARPTMPYKEIDRFDLSPMALLWHDRDMLWTAGQDGIFSQCDAAFAPRVLDRTPVSTMAFSSRGELAMFLDERAKAPRRAPASLHVVETRHHASPASPSYPAASPSNMFSVSRSDSEDDVAGSFLGTRKVGRSRRASLRSGAHALSTTPPSAPDDQPVASLDQSLKITGLFRTHQAMAVGPLPAAPRVEVYHFLASQYLETLDREFPHVPGGKPMVDRVVLILQHFARAADCVSQFRLAQTWRILAFAMEMLLKSRAQYHRSRRMNRARLGLDLTKEQRARFKDAGLVSVGRSSGGGQTTPRRLQPSATLSDRHLMARSLLSEEFESTSNVPTPLARPVGAGTPSRQPVSGPIDHVAHEMMPDVENFSLPPAAHPQFPQQRRRLDSTPFSDASHDSDNTQFSSTEGYDFYDMEAMAKAVDVPQSRQRELPTPNGYTHPTSPDRRKPPVFRHDSDESFAHMFSISQTSDSITGSPIRTRGSPRRRPPVTSAPSEHAMRRSSETDEDGEFRSRIRGKTLDLEYSPASSLRNRIHQQQTLRQTGVLDTQVSDDDYMRRLYDTQTTADSETSQQSGGQDPFLFAQQQPRAASRASSPSVQHHRPPQPRVNISPEDESSSDFIEGDYLPWQDDPDYPFPTSAAATSASAPAADSGNEPKTPLQPYSLLTRALDFEARHSALNASAIVLLLKPLVPEGLLDDFRAASILRQHHSRLMGMKLFVEAALLRNMCVQGWPRGVLESYWTDRYPAILSQGQQGVVASFLCSECKKPREIDRSSVSTDSVWHRCKRCRAVVGPCAVCRHHEDAPIFEEGPDFPPTRPQEKDSDGEEKGSTMAALGESDSVVAAWWYCAGCAHGGHSTCLSQWHGVSMLPGDGGSGSNTPPGSGFNIPSEGCCPVDGCGHACLPGRWRTESTATRTEEVSRAVMREASRSLAASSRGSPVLLPGNHNANNLLTSAGLPAPLLLAMASQHQQGGESPYGLHVHNDANEVAQSRAVEGVRDALGVGAGGGGGRSTAAPSLSSSPGRMGGGILGGGAGGGSGSGQAGGERERRKSVKFASADVERR
ncbi:hypothetical protein RB595_001784 [Gaeumannomyces hyphopodioides]